MLLNKPCECNFCNQFYFARSRHYKYSKNINEIYKKKIDENNIVILKKNDDIKEVDKNIHKKFTIDDLDIVSRLDSLNYNSDEISIQTNISESIVKHILNTINFWKK